jgi:hypothetical protein
VRHAYRVTLDTLHAGETLSELFARHGIPGFDFSVFHPDSAIDPRRARAGLVFAFRRLRTDSVPSRISVRRGPEERLHYERLGAEWRSRAEAIAWSSDPVLVEGPIGDALYLALDANVPEDVLDASERIRMAGNLAEIYDWTVDFTRDIRPGDYFRVLIERRVSEEGEVRLGRIDAADLTITGRHLLAYRFEGEDGLAVQLGTEASHPWAHTATPRHRLRRRTRDPGACHGRRSRASVRTGEYVRQLG